MRYKNQVVDYQGECPCGEVSLADGTEGHTEGKRTILLHKGYDNLLAVCPNHLHNYLSTPTFEYIGLEEDENSLK